jgi:hypothetical protein
MIDARSHSQLSFADEVGWKPSILSDERPLSDVWLERLAELSEVYRHPANWSNDACGNVDYPENKERWIAQFRTFIDSPKIWRLYERVHPAADRPNFRIARRSAALTWDDMGYFNKWSPCWTKESNGLLQRVVARLKKPLSVNN